MERKPLRARILGGELRCPVCRAKLADAHYGAFAAGIEVKCRCKRLVLLDVPKKE